MWNGKILNYINSKNLSFSKFQIVKGADQKYLEKVPKFCFEVIFIQI